MTLQPLFADTAPGVLYERIADALAENGYAVLTDVLPARLGEALFARCRSLNGDGFQPAGIGRDRDFHRNRFVRTDGIRWFDHGNSVEVSYLQWMERLRLALNRRLFLGLFDYECHFARYEKGAFYKRHIDAFRGSTNRVLSTVCYLNPGWRSADGGELVIYEGASSTPLMKALPQYGTLVLFLSERFPHEVLPAARERYSIAGWFRVNGSIGDAIDPPR